ncbi:MAG: asparagine synthase (glutamine-hydrolyzing) [Chitinophagia bacterium]|nr:asparagine synthase (glutamine-hydrolyzing) [Chitinophagia bacterium]
MCGICGIIDFNAKAGVHADRIRAMATTMSHRGPDAGGIHELGPAYLGHRRLSIIDLTSAADQPMTDVDGRFTLVFNGEIYNHLELRTLLPEYPFRTQSDTEVILAAFLRWGPSCVHRFKGMFAYAVWDAVERKLCLCRDRMGVKPLYVSVQDGRILFASELRSILSSGLVKPELDLRALYDYLSFQSFGYPLSPIRGVQQVESGSYIEFTEHASAKTVYWRPGAAKPDVDYSDRKALPRRVRDLLITSIRRRLVSDVPLGAFLSGGIDSSAVVALMAELTASPVNTFNVSFSEEAFDESRYAQVVAGRFATRHETIRMSPARFLSELEHAMEAMDTPSGDGPNTYVVSKAVRQAGLKVALSGIGGDELFAGYPFFPTWSRLNRWRNLFDATSHLRIPVARLLRNSGGNRIHRMADMLELDHMDVKGFYAGFRRVMSSPLIQDLTRIQAVESGCYAERMDGLSTGLPPLGQLSVAEYAGYTQQTLLKDTDQMSMAVSLEIREPFFDHELVDFVLHVPDHMKIGRQPKPLLVEAMGELLPREVVHRRKQGFLFPWRIWMRGELRGMCERHVGRLAERPFMRGDALLGRWRRFLSGDESVHWQEMWQFVVLEHWMERNHVQ